MSGRSPPGHGGTCRFDPNGEPNPLQALTEDRGLSSCPRGPLGRVERGDGFVERRDSPDMRAQSAVPHALDDLAQLGAIGLDDEARGLGRDSGELIPRRPRLEQVAQMGGERLDGCRDKGRMRANGEDACLARSLHGRQDPD